MDQTQAAPEAHITYYGGKWVAFAPILLAIVGLIYIAVKQADVPDVYKRQVLEPGKAGLGLS